jgi:hypothetical protein
MTDRECQKRRYRGMAYGGVAHGKVLEGTWPVLNVPRPPPIPTSYDPSETSFPPMAEVDTYRLVLCRTYSGHDFFEWVLDEPHSGGPPTIQPDR